MSWVVYLSSENRGAVRRSMSQSGRRLSRSVEAGLEGSGRFFRLKPHSRHGRYRGRRPLVCPDPSAAEESMEPAPRLPGYLLLQRLGGGPMTTVYEARDEDSGAACAVKVLRPDWADQATAVKL